MNDAYVFELSADSDACIRKRQRGALASSRQVEWRGVRINAARDSQTFQRPEEENGESVVGTGSVGTQGLGSRIVRATAIIEWLWLAVYCTTLRCIGLWTFVNLLTKGLVSHKPKKFVNWYNATSHELKTVF